MSQKIGIVGHAADKFSPGARESARKAIRELLIEEQPKLVISGRSPLGGIDIWAVEIAKELGIETREHAPRIRHWSAPGGYKERNLSIARESDLVVCIVVDRLPPGYKGMTFDVCYHCAHRGEPNPPHVKSGGCWTAWNAENRRWIVIPQHT